MTQYEMELAERTAKLLGVKVEEVKCTNLVGIIEQLVEVLESAVSNTR